MVFFLTWLASREYSNLIGIPDSLFRGREEEYAAIKMDCATPGNVAPGSRGSQSQGLASDPFGRVGVFSAPEVELAVIEFEAFLGLWLWSGKHPIGSWIAAILTMTAFTAVNFYQGVEGQTSCG